MAVRARAVELGLVHAGRGERLWHRVWFHADGMARDVRFLGLSPVAVGRKGSSRRPVHSAGDAVGATHGPTASVDSMGLCDGAPLRTAVAVGEAGSIRGP